MASNYNEPTSLTEDEEIESEIIEEEPIDNNVSMDIVSPEEIQTEYEDTSPVIEPEESTYIETGKVERIKPEPEKARKSKRKIPVPVGSESRSLSKLHSELHKHSDARKKTDLAIKDIEKQLKALLLAHHSAIKDLKEQVTQIRTKLATIESKKSTAKKGAKKTITKNSKWISKKLIKKR